MTCCNTNANRIYYGNQQLAIKGMCNTNGSGVYDLNECSGCNYDFAASQVIKGLQSITSNTTFNDRQVFQIWAPSIYANIEDIPEVELTMSKVADGYCPLLHAVTVDAIDPTLIGRSEARAAIGISIFDDTSPNILGQSPESTAVFPDVYWNSWSINIPVDGEVTEELTVIGNDKIWLSYNGLDIPCDSSCTLPAGASGLGITTVPSGCIVDPDFCACLSTIDLQGYCDNDNNNPAGPGGVQTLENVLLDCDNGVTALDVNGQLCDADCTILPPDIPGVDCSGRPTGVCLQNITISTDLNREEFRCLGTKKIKFRAVDFPVEVTTEIEIIGTVGDAVSFTSEGIFSCDEGICTSKTNRQDRTIRVALCDGTRIYTGLKNVLQSVNTTGGDAGGGNVSISYTYRTFNDLTFIHQADCNPSGDAFWTNRDTYLCNPA